MDSSFSICFLEECDLRSLYNSWCKMLEIDNSFHNLDHSLDIHLLMGTYQHHNYSHICFLEDRGRSLMGDNWCSLLQKMSMSYNLDRKVHKYFQISMFHQDMLNSTDYCKTDCKFLKDHMCHMLFHQNSFHKCFSMLCIQNLLNLCSSPKQGTH